MNMIYTVTTSPSLDLVMKLQSPLQVGTNTRAMSEELRPGGKGVNISIMLHNLGITSTAFGFVAGFSGDELMRMTAALGVKTGFIRVRRGRTRINVKLKDDQNTTTSINGLGPQVAADDIQYLVRKISALTNEDFLVLAGMVPPSLPQDIYTTFFESLKPENAPKVIVDAPVELCLPVLKFHPFLIKPNVHELSSKLGFDIKNANDVITACQHLQSLGAVNILVSLGCKGAIVVGEHRSYRIPAPSGTVNDKTGAGDSMIAGFLADYIINHDLESASYMAVAAGSATAMTPGISNSEMVMNMRSLMQDQAEWGEELI